MTVVAAIGSGTSLVSRLERFGRQGEHHDGPGPPSRRVDHCLFGCARTLPCSTWPHTHILPRQECSRARVHAPFVAGISGTKERGAYSIVLSGVSGYEDDVDEGDRMCVELRHLVTFPR